ncbi:ribosomal RNA small subunit methyltransferase A [Patescibacteria group bacterium]|nr:MAG: ribosomal RNA small subunit methyltransferase A [Patescibacteria group bacterium]
MLPRAKKSFGQNFLQDASVLRKIVSAAGIVLGEAVLEIGPGTGVLTQALVDAGAKVTAIEADHDLIPGLRERFGDRITLVEGDALKFDLRTDPTMPPLSKGRVAEASYLPLGKGEHEGVVGGAFKLVANIPYHITSPILERFLAHEPRPSRMVLMVQKEVADRITAKPGDMGLLSVVCQLYADVRKVTNVPRGAFRPIPKVDSAVVRLDLRTDPAMPPLSKGRVAETSYLPLGKGEHEGVAPREKVIRLAKAGFSHPRKQLHGNLVAAGYGTTGQVKEMLSKAGLDPKARAETLAVDEWVSLARALDVV